MKILDIEDETGIIMGEGTPPKVTIGKIVPGVGAKPETEIHWWKIRIDRTGEEKELPDDQLEMIE